MPSKILCTYKPAKEIKKHSNGSKWQHNLFLKNEENGYREEGNCEIKYCVDYPCDEKSFLELVDFLAPKLSQTFRRYTSTNGQTYKSHTRQLYSRKTCDWGSGIDFSFNGYCPYEIGIAAFPEGTSYPGLGNIEVKYELDDVNSRYTDKHGYNRNYTLIIFNIHLVPYLSAAQINKEQLMNDLTQDLKAFEATVSDPDAINELVSPSVYDIGEAYFSNNITVKNTYEVVCQPAFKLALEKAAQQFQEEKKQGSDSVVTKSHPSDEDYESQFPPLSNSNSR